MARQKKIKPIKLEENPEANMTETLEAPEVDFEKIKMEIAEERKELQALKEQHASEGLELLEGELDRVRKELEDTKRQIEEKKHELKYVPAREIDEDEMLIVKKHQNISVEKKALSEKIAKQKAIDCVMVTGKFINRRAPGQSAKLTYMRYDTDPVKWYVFEDGKVYTIPAGFAEEINAYYHTPVFTQKTEPMDPNKPESQIHSVDTSNKKYGFFPMN
jgi:DNA gyrase/topoisomerase IV subunit A